MSKKVDKFFEEQVGVLPPETDQFLKVAFAALRRKKQGAWRGMAAVPPGSLMAEIINEFQLKTNIALEIPLATFLHFVAGALIQKESRISFMDEEIEADFWSLVLAPSGAGKTWTQKKIGAGLEGVVPTMEIGAASAAAWLLEFASQPRTLWIKDEFYQLLKSIEQPGPLADLKGYLLQIYDNSTIERSTKKDVILVENPVLSILGFTALQPFADGISTESLLDGFSQRFGFFLALPDEQRKWQDFPVWKIDSAGWAPQFLKMTEGILPLYEASFEAEEAFLSSFSSLSGGVKLEESFFRRVMWRAHKFALCYHIIRGRAHDPRLSSEDYGWAARLLEMQLADAAQVLEMCSQSNISQAIDAGAKIVDRLRAEGKPITARSILARTRLIGTAGTARFILSVLGVPESVHRPRVA